MSGGIVKIPKVKIPSQQIPQAVINGEHEFLKRYISKREVRFNLNFLVWKKQTLP